MCGRSFGFLSARRSVIESFDREGYVRLREVVAQNPEIRVAGLAQGGGCLKKSALISTEKWAGGEMVIERKAENFRFFHPREPWGKGGTDYVQVHCRLDDLYGMTGPDAETNKGLYNAAKSEGNFRAAYEIIVRHRSEEKLKALKEVIATLKTPALFVYPRKLDFGDSGRTLDPERPTNALPVTLTRFVSARVGGEICKDIIQMRIRKRTTLNRLIRFLYQPAFKGRVIPGRRYVLVDDVISSGALFASLRSHIVKGGGLVIGMTALAHVSGRDQKLAISRDSLQAMRIEFGEKIDAFWNGKFGHGIEHLTDQEAKYLLGRWRSQHQSILSGSQLLECLAGEIEHIQIAHSKYS